MIVLGVDCSTATVAFCFLDTNHEKLIQRENDFFICQPKGKNFWEKLNELKIHIQNLKIQPDKIFIEEPLCRFLPGSSSIQTIITLQRFNIACQMLMQAKWKIDPIEVSAATARKACKVRLVPKKKHPLQKDHKNQTFDHIMLNDLKHLTWPLKKNGKVIDSALDSCDAYVVARGAINLKL